MIRKTVLVLFLCCIIAVTATAMHDEPGSYREYELKEERFEIEANITELFYQLNYVPVSVRPRVYQELRDLEQRWNQVIQELIEIDLTEHPQP
jgi:predicted transcriptional regulator